MVCRMLRSVRYILSVAMLTFGDHSMAQPANIPVLVDAALADNPAPGSSAAVIAAGDDAIPVLAARLKLADHPSRRADIIGLLRAINSPAVVPPLLPLMSDDDFDTRERSAQAVFSVVSAHGVPKTRVFAEAVLAGLDDKPSAATLLLAGFVPQARDALIRNADARHLVKLGNDGPAVSAGLAAQLSLSLLGNADARRRLESAMPTASPDHLKFCLDAMAVIDAPTLLHALADATLSNDTPIGDGLPSGATPARRLSDHAVETFVRRLNLDGGFKIDHTRQYTEDETRAVAIQIERALPRS